MTIERIEHSSLRTWPALHEEEYDGWLLRRANGMTRRNNSVNPVAPSTIGVTDKIRYCEDWFTRHDLPCIFRLTPLAEAGLEDRLRECGYAVTAGADVLARAIGDPPPAGPARIDSEPTSGWFSVFTEGRSGPVDRPTLGQLWRSVPGPVAFATSMEGSRAIAVGTGVVDDGMLAVFNMRTRPTHRRSGHARAIVATLSAWAAKLGATSAYLQVAPENGPARALYEALGFRHSYSYAYATPTVAERGRYPRQPHV